CMYKPLFEFRILHQYYLSGKDGSSVLDTSDIQNDQQARQNSLQEKFNSRVPSITDDLSFSLSELFETEYKKFDLRLFPSYSGFRLFLPVKEVKQPDGPFWYKPLRTIPADLPIVVEI